MNWKEIGRRFVATIAYAAIAVLIGEGTGKIDLTLLQGALFAAVYAAFTFGSLVARDALGYLAPGAPVWERVAWTFGQAALGALAAMPLGVESVEAALIVGATAALNLIKSGLNSFLQMPVGDPPAK